MAYQTGTFTSMSDLRATLESFATANGWTQAGSLLYKGSVYVEVADTASYLSVKVGLGKDGSNQLTTPSSFTRGIAVSGFAGQTISYPGNYHLISLSSPDNIFLVVNYNVTYWQHLAFGVVRKYGTWGGGEYASGSSHGTQDSSVGLSTVMSTIDAGCGYFAQGESNFNTGNAVGSADLYCDLDGEGWRLNRSDFLSINYSRFSGSAQAVMLLQSLMTWNDQTMLAPVYFEVGRTGGFRSFVGDMPHVRYIRVDNIDDGEIITVGSQDWICFPHLRKSPTIVENQNSSNHSSVMGWAIKYDGP